MADDPFSPAQRAAALHGVALNEMYPTDTRLAAALESLAFYEKERECPVCEGTGLCRHCRGGSINEPGLSCIGCGSSHFCVTCTGRGVRW